jgi:hypothetical protein
MQVEWGITLTLNAETEFILHLNSIGRRCAAA